ncbi:type IX secretion system plug protein [Belliella filtrata]
MILVLTIVSMRTYGQDSLQDRVFEENIQSVRLFPQSTEFATQMSSPAISLQANTPLLLSFDDIAFDPDMYSVRLIHCDMDWTPSDLKENDYLEQFNEFNITDYNYSIDTRIPYIHYNFVIPRVTKSGNYVVQVYRGREQDKTIITRRFMVFDNSIQVGAKVVPPSQTEYRRKQQQLNINLNYKGREVLDPRTGLRVVIRQNQRWDNIITDLKPTMVREDLKTVAFELFDGTNAFFAGNEFRFVDLRYVRARGNNVAKVQMEEDVVYAETMVEKARPSSAYSQYLDMNGQYVIFNFERQNHDLEGEYMLATFNLNAEGITETPYLVGALTNWGRVPDAKMELNKKTNTYQATLLLKQGWYDYQFAYKTDEGWNMSPIEGDHFETENEYEVLVYFRDVGSRYDELVGYSNVNPNKRRL